MNNKQSKSRRRPFARALAGLALAAGGVAAEEPLRLDRPAWTLRGAEPGRVYEIYCATGLAEAHPWRLAQGGLAAPAAAPCRYEAHSQGPGLARSPLFFAAGVAVDSDGDGLSDGYEARVAGTRPDAADSDGNGRSDGDEDFDGDGLCNREEYLGGPNGATNPWKADTDGDGVSDGPLAPPGSGLAAGPDAFPVDPSAWLDTDGDGQPDERHGASTSAPGLVEDEDDDGDGLPDLWELQQGLDPKNGEGNDGPDADPDFDGRSNREEYLAGTRPRGLVHVSPLGANIAPYADWASAATQVDSGLQAAVDGDVVLVAEGVYRPAGGEGERWALAGKTLRLVPRGLVVLAE